MDLGFDLDARLFMILLLKSLHFHKGLNTGTKVFRVVMPMAYQKTTA
jgi:hypothetical protein